MTTKAAVLAFAAPLLLSAPALADRERSRISDTTSLTLNVGAGALTLSTGSRGHYGHDQGYDRGYDRGQRLNAYGQTPREARRLRADAIRACTSKVARIGYRAGFKEVSIDDDWKVRQVGPAGFIVRLTDVEFEGRRRDFQTRVTCEVRRGQVVDVQGIPQRGQRGYHARAVADYPGYGGRPGRAYRD